MDHTQRQQDDQNVTEREANRRSVLKGIGSGALLAGGLGVTSSSAGASTDDSTHYHNELYGPHFPDPTIHRAPDGRWWAYGTNMDRDDGSNNSEERLVPILSSTDLVNWTYQGEAFDTRPGWGGVEASIWAPDIHYYQGPTWDSPHYVLFYSHSPRNGSLDETGIGLAISDTPDGPFTDIGQITPSDGSEPDPLIDPYFVEVNGTPYMVVGSTIVYAVELTSDLLHYKPETMTIVAGGYEGPIVIRRNGYWYLFVSTGDPMLGFDSTYELEVGRSQSLFGPYVDPAGNELTSYKTDTDGDGTEEWSLTANLGITQFGDNARFVAPGHGDITVDDYGRDWLVYHGYDTWEQEYVDGVPARQFFIDRIEWTSDDWPIIGGDKTPSLQSVKPNATDSGIVSDGIYEIENVNSGKLMEVAYGGTNDGDNVQQHSWNGCACQRWWVEYIGSGEYRIINQNSNKALDVPAGTTQDGESLHQWNWTAAGPQKWEIIQNGDGTYRLRSVASGDVADVYNFQTTDGADIVQWPWSGTANQKWRLNFVDTVQPTDDGRPW